MPTPASLQTFCTHDASYCIFGDIRGLDIEELRPILPKHGINHLDSAAIYDGGESENRLGEASIPSDFTIDTKILWAMPTDGHLTPEKIDASSKASLERLKTDKVNVLYIHVPDHTTPIKDQAEAFDDMWKKGRFEAVGLSNSETEYVKERLDFAAEKGYIKPTWYVKQGSGRDRGLA